jgi:hypothetical protein
MDGKLRRRLEKALSEVDEHGTTGPRLVDDAQRLWGRVRKFIDMNLIATEPDLEALELACYALQLPQRQTKLASSKLGRQNLKQRAEQAAELLVTMLAEEADEGLLDRATRLLHETPQRQPMIEEARLLADAVNLDDFGVSGLAVLMVQLAIQGGGAKQLVEAYEKREEYGYWDARLKEGFHFEVVRQMAVARLAAARSAAEALLAEIKEDQP